VVAQQQQTAVTGYREAVREIIAGADYARLVKQAEEWGKQLKDEQLTMAQIRRIFGEVKRLQMRWDSGRLRMLKVRLAYAAARGQRGRRAGETLRQILTPAIDAVFDAGDEKEQERRFNILVDLFEAVLAYFTYHERRGGRS